MPVRARAIFLPRAHYSQSGVVYAVLCLRHVERIKSSSAEVTEVELSSYVVLSVKLLLLLCVGEKESQDDKSGHFTQVSSDW